MERGLMMLLHSAIISSVIYLVMVYVVGQSKSVSESRSLLIGAILLIYMLMFGHALPKF
jgi:hypothetical protein